MAGPGKRSEGFLKKRQVHSLVLRIHRNPDPRSQVHERKLHRLRPSKTFRHEKDVLIIERQCFFGELLALQMDVDARRGQMGKMPVIQEGNRLFLIDSELRRLAPASCKTEGRMNAKADRNMDPLFLSRFFDPRNLARAVSDKRRELQRLPDVLCTLSRRRVLDLLFHHPKRNCQAHLGCACRIRAETFFFHHTCHRKERIRLQRIQDFRRRKRPRKSPSAGPDPCFVIQVKTILRQEKLCCRSLQTLIHSFHAPHPSPPESGFFLIVPWKTFF